MDTAVLDHVIVRQQSIFESLPILADILRSDVLYYDELFAGQLVVTAHAQPRSLESIYPENRKYKSLTLERESPFLRAIRSGARIRDIQLTLDHASAPVHQEIIPIRDHLGKVMGALTIETTEAEYASARNRGGRYQHAMTMLKEMAVRGDLREAGRLTAFTGRDGLVVVSRDMRIDYVSNIAEGFYGKLGISQKLVGERVDSLETGDEHLIWQVLRERHCVEREEPVRDAVWIRKALPLIAGSSASPRPRPWVTLNDSLPEPKAVLLLIRDVTQERQREQDQLRLQTMIREIHHRVKNNLQTIISLARVEARRAQSAETKRALDELMNRIFAVAQVHEFLSTDNSNTIQLKEVSKQIARQVRDSLLPRDSRVSIEVEGDALPLPPRQATACSLIVNELVQNAVEHAFADGDGVVRIQLEDSPERVRIAVVDNGRGLPEGFEWRHSQSLGLKIVHTLVQDLRGELNLINQTEPSHGLIAQITLSRMLPGGK